MSNFEIGDTVRLKSGGPLMTIDNIGDYSPTGPNPGLLCVWFDGGKRVAEVFHQNTVVLERDDG